MAGKLTGDLRIADWRPAPGFAWVVPRDAAVAHVGPEGESAFCGVRDDGPGATFRGDPLRVCYRCAAAIRKLDGLVVVLERWNSSSLTKEHHDMTDEELAAGYRTQVEIWESGNRELVGFIDPQVMEHGSKATRFGGEVS